VSLVAADMAEIISREEFELLFRTVAPELAGYLRRQAIPDVEDLVADAFVTAWRRRSELPRPELRRAWLFGVVRRLSLAQGRRLQRDRAVAHGLAAVPSGGRECSDDVATAVVTRALERLKSADRS
jgi:DNA-directed RNA polymerase specialized sigma24 family protein